MDSNDSSCGRRRFGTRPLSLMAILPMPIRVMRNEVAATERPDPRGPRSGAGRSRPAQGRRESQAPRSVTKRVDLGELNPSSPRGFRALEKFLWLVAPIDIFMRQRDVDRKD